MSDWTTEAFLETTDGLMEMCFVKADIDDILTLLSVTNQACPAHIEYRKIEGFGGKAAGGYLENAQNGSSAVTLAQAEDSEWVTLNYSNGDWKSSGWHQTVALSEQLKTIGVAYFGGNDFSNSEIGVFIKGKRKWWDSGHVIKNENVNVKAGSDSTYSDMYEHSFKIPIPAALAGDKIILDPRTEFRLKKAAAFRIDSFNWEIAESCEMPIH